MNSEIKSTNNLESISDKEIFSKIWTKPRKVFKFINDKHYGKYVNLLLVLAGISRAFDRASTKNMGDQMSIWAILGMCIIFGGLLGWISYYLYAALLSWTGKWLDGKGDTTSIVRILSYAMTPAIIALLFLIPQIGIYGNEIFKADGDITSAGLISNIIVYGSMILEFILGIWTVVFCVIGVSEVQKLSIGKSILNLLLPMLVFAVPIIILVLIFQAI
ncbi:Yip1 family protein [uncultured Aquimarina sp.]|uniref:Yip1 family protein n=1 Tax=uncultured Aquimarina sp. TaxID=575652 RepID=UPI00260F6E27|nr:Yip1 family protein [uncultured Aquimarina sp.]